MSLLDRFKKTEKKETSSNEKRVVSSVKKNEKAVKKEASKSVKKTQKTKQGKIQKGQMYRVYDIIKEPHITEKASYLAEQNKYVFKVYPKANKTEVKKAVEALYETKVKKVSIARIVPKKRRVGRTEGWRGGLKKGFKKAIVTLKEGEKIEIISG